MEKLCCADMCACCLFRPKNPGKRTRGEGSGRRSNKRLRGGCTAARARSKTTPDDSRPGHCCCCRLPWASPWRPPPSSLTSPAAERAVASSQLHPSRPWRARACTTPETVWCRRPSASLLHLERQGHGVHRQAKGRPSVLRCHQLSQYDGCVALQGVFFLGSGGGSLKACQSQLWMSGLTAAVCSLTWLASSPAPASGLLCCHGAAHLVSVCSWRWDWELMHVGTGVSAALFWQPGNNLRRTQRCGALAGLRVHVRALKDVPLCCRHCPLRVGAARSLRAPMVATPHR
jgi:hypothetical protein